MFHFNQESSWLDELQQLKDIRWQQHQFKLEPLSDQPFNMLHSITAESKPMSVAESVTITEASSMNDEMEYEQEDIWTNYTIPTTLNTLSWDTHNNHYPSFAQTRLAQKNIGTPFLTEAPTSLFEPVIQSRTDMTVKVVYESQLVKSLIQAMVGLPSIYFIWNNNQFQMLPVRILGVSATAIQPALKDILAFGTRLRRIDHVVQTCRDNPGRYGLTGLALSCCLSQLHVNMQYTLVSVFEKEDHVTVLRVHQYVNDLSTLTKKLCDLCCIDSTAQLSREQTDHIAKYGFYLPFGVKILNLLYAEIQQFDLALSGNHALYRDTCLSLLCHTSEPYNSILSNWLGLDSSGLLVDPYNEFFITTHEQIQDLLKRFQIRENPILPYFINNDLAVYIFRSGQSLQLLKRTRPDHPLFDLNDSMPLKYLLKNTSSDEYMEKILKTCQSIQACESVTNTIELPILESSIIEEAQSPIQEPSDDTPMEDDMIPRLPFLDTNPNIHGEFLATLTELIEHEQQSTSFIPTIDTITSSSYLKPLNVWCPMLNASFMSFFIDEFKLQSHLSLLFDYYLFGNSEFVIGLKETFFKSRIRLEHETCWPPRPYQLNAAFRNLLLEEDLVSFSIRESTESSVWLNPNSVEALDFLQLNYNATYPLDIVITPVIIEKYNRIFTFLLQILRVNTIPNHSYKHLKNIEWHHTSIRDKIFCYRFQMDQFMNAIQGYVHDTAIQGTWSRFMQHVKGMQTSSNDVYSIIMEPHRFKEYHEHVLDCILYQCFSKKSQLRVLNTLYATMHDIVIFGAVLDDYTVTDIKAEEKLLMKCKKIFEQFQRHVAVFVRILHLIEEKGSGRLSNILNNTSVNVFKDLYAKHEAKLAVDVFVKDLIVRLNLNGFYNE